jgi:hypothetical protein
MGIEVNWENETKTIIQYVYDGRWTLRDFDDARIQAARLEETVTHRVDVIVDVRNSSLVPTGTISRGKQVITTTPTSHPSEGMAVIVGAGPLVRSIYDVVSKVYPDVVKRRGFRFARTMDEARAIIAQEAASRSSTPA